MTQDLKNALRLFAKSPGFTAAAILTLAVGVGATCTMFAGVDALFLRALALPDPDRVVTLWAANRAAGFDHANASYRDFEDWRRQARSFERLAAFVDVAPTLSGGREPETLPIARVSGDFFAILGGHPILGRTVTSADDRPEAGRVAVLSHGAWRRRYGADPRVLGSSLKLDGQLYSVVGVMPADFALPGDEGVEVWTALTPDLGSPERGDREFFVIGRLRRGVTVVAARAELDAISLGLAAAYPKSNAGFQVNVIRLEDDLFGKKFRVGLLTLLGAVALVLAIGCANIAQLLLARSGAREREFAVRTALGASRAILVRQMLTESALLAAAGGAAGLLVAVGGVDGFLKLLPQGTARLPEIRLDARVFLFGLLVSAASAAAVGLLPALHASRGGFGESLRDSSSRTAAGGRRRRLQALLVASEVALAIVLLSGAGLLVKSLSHLRRVDPGFRPAGVVTLQVDLPEREYPQEERARSFYEPLLDRLAGTPGVAAAAAVSTLPMSGNNSWTFVTVEGRPNPPLGQESRVGRLVVSPDYFRALGIPIIEGRSFQASDSASAPRVAIVNREMARRLGQGKPILGTRVKRGRSGDERPWVEIVGVAGNVRHRGVAAEVRPEIFFPLSQTPERSMTLVVAASDLPGAANAVRREIRALRPEQAVSNVQTMSQFLAGDTAAASLLTGLLAAFATAALLLAMMGLYAVVSLAVGQSTREIGIRMALGAQGRDVVRLILRRWLGLTGAGILAGLAATLLLGRVLSSLLFSVKPADGAVLLAITALLAAVATLASYIPARRATRVDPIRALRAE
jgi:putative ABC transport system permease protein